MPNAASSTAEDTPSRANAFWYEGLDGANANLMGQVTLAWNDERTSREAIVERLAKAGFPELAAV